MSSITCCNAVGPWVTEVSDGASGRDSLLAASLLDFTASVELGRDGGLGKAGA